MTQIELLEYNLSENMTRPHKTWHGTEHANNLFNLHIPFEVRGEDQKERMQRLLDYLNRIVFKLIVSSERIQYFVTG